MLTSKKNGLICRGHHDLHIVDNDYNLINRSIGNLGTTKKRKISTGSSMQHLGEDGRVEINSVKEGVNFNDVCPWVDGERRICLICSLHICNYCLLSPPHLLFIVMVVCCVESE